MIKLARDYTNTLNVINETIKKLKSDGKDYEWLLEEKDFWERVVMNQKAQNANVLKCSLHEAMGVDISSGVGLDETAYLLERDLEEICASLDKIKDFKEKLIAARKEEMERTDELRKDVFKLIRHYEDGCITENFLSTADEYQKISESIFDRANNCLNIDDKNDSLAMSEALQSIAKELKKKSLQ